MKDPRLDAYARAAQAGDRDALGALLAGLRDPVLRVALRFLGERAHAEDATQEILVLVLTKLSTWRGECAITTWTYRVGCRHLLRARSRLREVSFEAMAAHDLAQPASEPPPGLDARLLEEEVFLGCTQAMLRALDRDDRIAFVLGAICEVEAPDAAFALELTPAAFRKRLSRARGRLDDFTRAHCGVANPARPCRCRHQVRHGLAQGRIDPTCLRYARPSAETSLEALRAQGELTRVRRALELYRAQPVEQASAELGEKLRALLAGTAGGALFG